MNANTLNHLIYKADPRDRSFMPWRLASTPEAAAIVAECVSLVENFETHYGLLKQRRSAKQQDNFEAAIASLVCDLMHRHITSDEGDGRIHLSLDTSAKARNMYSAPFEGKPTVLAIKRLCAEELGLAVQKEMGTFGGRQSAFAAGPGLLRRMDDHAIDIHDLTLDDAEEIVILKTAKHDPRNAVKNRAEWTPYIRTHRTNRFKKEVREINAYLREADLDYEGPGFVDISDRHLRRYFNNSSFNEGGRLFSGWWQRIKKQYRKHISIDGKTTAEVDFNSMMVSLAYAEMDLPLPEGDAYALKGLLGHRDGVKKITAALFFAEKPLRRWPEETLHLFPLGTRLTDVVNAIKAKHEPLEVLWERGQGHRFHHTESEVLIDALLECYDRNITALPNHDSLIVPFTAAADVEEIMVSKFEGITGLPGRVSTTANY